MRIRNIVASGVTFVVVAGSVIASTGTANASTGSCFNNTTHHHSVTAKGTVTDYNLHKYGCTGRYTEVEAGNTWYASGAYSWSTWGKVVRGKCWTKSEARHSVSAKGKVTNKVTYSGNC